MLCRRPRATPGGPARRAVHAAPPPSCGRTSESRRRRRRPTGSTRGARRQPAAQPQLLGSAGWSGRSAGRIGRPTLFRNAVRGAPSPPDPGRVKHRLPWDDLCPRARGGPGPNGNRECGTRRGWRLSTDSDEDRLARLHRHSVLFNPWRKVISIGLEPSQSALKSVIVWCVPARVIVESPFQRCNQQH
jgi:hypothetical protein